MIVKEWGEVQEEKEWWITSRTLLYTRRSYVVGTRTDVSALLEGIGESFTGLLKTRPILIRGCTGGYIPMGSPLFPPFLHRSAVRCTPEREHRLRGCGASKGARPRAPGISSRVLPVSSGVYHGTEFLGSTVNPVYAQRACAWASDINMFSRDNKSYRVYYYGKV